MRTRRRVLLPVLGMGAAVLVIGVLVSVIHFVIQPAMSRETWGRTIYRGETVDLWFTKESPHAATHQQLEGDLESLLSQLLDRLELDRADIPLPFDVFVHDDIDQLMESVAARAGVDVGRLDAPLDLLPSEDPRLRLTEVLLAYGWGRCASQAFYRGVLLYVALPEKDFHTYVAALPERMRHSIQDLVLLEQSGAFARTFYQRHTSPYASRFLLTLEAMGVYLSIPRVISESPEVDVLSLEAASLVKFLVESETDMGAVREVWDDGFLDTILRRISSDDLAELNAAWQEEATARGQDGEGYELLHAHFLVDGGEFDRARAITAAWAHDAADLDQLDVQIRSALLAGELDAAAQLTVSSDGAALPSDLRAWIEVTSAMNVAATEHVRVIGDQSPSELEGLLDELDSTYLRLSRELEGTLSQVPLPITVFSYRARESCEIGVTATRPDFYPRASLHITVTDDAARELVGFALASGWHPTRSPALADGLVDALLRDRGELRDEACNLYHADRWIPLERMLHVGHDEPALRVELALLLQLALEDRGVGAIRSMWQMTTQLGGAMSFASAIDEALGLSLAEAESEFLAVGVLCDAVGSP